MRNTRQKVFKKVIESIAQLFKCLVSPNKGMGQNVLNMTLNISLLTLKINFKS